MTLFGVWLALSIALRILFFIIVADFGVPPIETATGRYFFLGTLVPVIGDVVALCAMMYYGLEWAAEGRSQDDE